eukprot:scaffold124020_cov18-Tisochrysis_lutea.AAC.1
MQIAYQKKKSHEGATVTVGERAVRLAVVFCVPARPDAWSWIAGRAMRPAEWSRGGKLQGKAVTVYWVALSDHRSGPVTDQSGEQGQQERTQEDCR